MARAIAFNVRQWHKWVSLFVGIQAMLWLASGLYMVIINLNFIHGDHLVRNMSDTLPPGYTPGFGFEEVMSSYPQAELISLETWLGKPYYRVHTIDGRVLVDAQTGIQRSPLDRTDAIAVAQYHYARPGEAKSAQLLVDQANAPSEIQGRKLPLWRIDFEDPGRTSFYVSPDDGALVTRRHDYWRIFDFVWMLHIMDYKDRADVNNTLLRAFAGLGLILSIAGIWLLWFSFKHRRGVR